MELLVCNYSCCESLVLYTINNAMDPQDLILWICHSSSEHLLSKRFTTMQHF